MFNRRDDSGYEDRRHGERGEEYGRNDGRGDGNERFGNQRGYDQGRQYQGQYDDRQQHQQGGYDDRQQHPHGGPPPGPHGGGFPGQHSGYGQGAHGGRAGYGGQQEGYDDRQRQQGYGGQQNQQGGYDDRQRQQGYGRQQSQQSPQGGYDDRQHQQGYGGQQSQQGQGGYDDRQRSGNQQQGGGNMQRPSTQSQSFGVDGYNYQYSACDGKKKALLIGINYFNTKAQLNGCINDVQNMKQFLLSKGFNEKDMVVLTDDQSSARAVPTHQNIIDAASWLTKDARANDSLFFHYSGHGGQTADQDGDEEDGYDEVIYPLDYETNGQITDDELHRLLVSPLPKGCRMTALFDSCHSGSVLDIPYMYSTKGVIKEPDMMKEAGEGLLTTIKAYASGDQRGVTQGLTGIFKTVMNSGKAEKANEVTKNTKTSPADVISLSGCKDSQTSADAKEDGKSTGAMSYAFLQVMKQDSNQSYISLLNNTRNVLKAKYAQKPQLAASHPIDVNLQFII